MYDIRSSAGYRKSYKKISRSGKFDSSELDRVINALALGEKLAIKYRDHFLTGEYEGFRECHVKPDLLLIYKIEEGNLILLLVNIGSHSELFG
jgi:mRNA interferase YafQ